MNNIHTNNKAEVIGEVFSDFHFSHEVYSEKFYYFSIKIPRLSEIADYIIVTISENLLYAVNLKIGDIVMVSGQFRSYNNYTSYGNKLILTLFAKSISKTDKINYVNNIELNGFICKKPIYRTTPFGREITDILLAVNRTHNKSDYIPCISWGRNAKFAEKLNVGDNVFITGRIQSREYVKKADNDENITKIAYEISVNKIEFFNNNEFI